MCRQQKHISNLGTGHVKSHGLESAEVKTTTSTIKVKLHLSPFLSLFTYLSDGCRSRQEDDCRWRRRRRERRRMQQCFHSEAIAVVTRVWCQHTLSPCPLSLIIYFNQPTVYKPPWQTDESANQERTETDTVERVLPIAVLSLSLSNQISENTFNFSRLKDDDYTDKAKHLRCIW